MPVVFLCPKASNMSKPANNFWRQMHDIIGPKDLPFFENWLYIKRLCNSRIENYTTRNLVTPQLSRSQQTKTIKRALKVGLCKWEGNHIVFNQIRKSVNRWKKTSLKRPNYRINGRKTLGPKQLRIEIIYARLKELNSRCERRFLERHSNKHVLGNSHKSKIIRASVLKRDFKFTCSAIKLAEWFQVSKSTALNYLKLIKEKFNIKIEWSQSKIGKANFKDDIPYGCFYFKGCLYKRTCMTIKIH